MPLKQTLSRHWFRFQRELFPWLEEALGPLGERYQRLVRVVELVWVEESRSGSRSGKHPVNEKDRFLLAFNSSAFIGFHRISDSRVCNGSIVAPLGREEIRFSSWSFVVLRAPSWISLLIPLRVPSWTINNPPIHLQWQ